jgi:hypothetical protein
MYPMEVDTKFHDLQFHQKFVIEMSVSHEGFQDGYSDIDFVSMVSNFKNRPHCRECLSLTKSTETMEPNLAKTSQAEQVHSLRTKLNVKEHTHSLAHVYFIHHRHQLELL